MSFEFTGLTYDPTRKVTTTQQFTVKDPTTNEESKKAYMPVPYNMQFELALMCKLNDDALQVTEQILPYFQPSYNLTVELVDSIKEKRDIPIVLENITKQDDYEGDFTQRRVLLYTMRFTAKTYLFGPVQSATKDIIRKATINYISGDSKSVQRDVRYSATPRAIKSYTGTVLTNLAADVAIADTQIKVNDASGITADSSTLSYLNIGEEEIFVKSKSGNDLIVERGRDGTTIGSHLTGAEVKSITDSDDALIPEGDDFGFSGEYV